jgi:anti-sigma regulatory factor (Ser/Thr protein kinase)
MGKVQVVDASAAPSGNPGLDLLVRASPTELSAAREALSQLPIPPSLLEDVRLLASELVANSIKHAGISPDDWIRLRARVAGGSLRVDVIDAGRGGPLPLPGGVRPVPGASSGWGLYLVDVLATRWGYSGGRCWFEIELSDYRSRLGP